MFRAFFRSSPSPTNAATDASSEPLTPLPPKLHLRTASSAAALAALQPASPTSLEAIDGAPRPPVQEWRHSGGSFAELLSREPRESVLVHDDGEGGAAKERGESMLVLPGGQWAVTGPDARLVVEELHRLRLSLSQRRRRRAAYSAGALSLAELLATLWVLVETAAALIEEGGKGRGVVRWVQLASWLTVVVGWVPVFALLKTLWLLSLRRYNLFLHTPLIVSPSALPSSELRALLERHRADIVPLPSSSSGAPFAPHLSRADDLPLFPERAAHYALVSEGEQSAMWSYRGSEHSRFPSAGSAGAGAAGGVATWVGAKVLGGVRWLFGMRPYEAAAREVEQEQDREREEDEEERAGMSGARDGQDENELLRPPSMAAVLSQHTSAWLDPPAPSSGEEYRSLFSGLSRPRSTSSFSFTPGSRRHSTGTVGSSAPLVDRSPASAIEEEDERPLPPPPPSQRERDLPPPPPPPRDHPTHGSSGSSQGAIIYIRMLDGRLVRRLSTIASLSDAGVSSSEAPSVPHTRGGHSPSSGSDSFATAREGESREDLQLRLAGEEGQEVLVVEAADVEGIEQWRWTSQARE
ncbi:hypothetical protein JCM10207_008620 [Rhodosporidiobolus poonsookiae]